MICNLKGGPKPQFRVNQCQLDLASRLLFCLMSVSLQFRVFQQGVPLVSRVLFCLMSVNLQFRQGVELVNRGLFCLMSANLFLLITRLRGSPPPPPPLFANPAQPVFRLPTAPISGGVQHETPQNPVAREEGVQTLQEALSSTHQTIASLRASGISPPQSLLDSASSLATKLQDARLSSPRPGVSSSAKPRSPQRSPTRPETTRRVPETTRRGPETTRRTPETTQRAPDRPESTPMGPGRPEFDPAVPGPSRRRSFDSPQRSSDHSSRQGSHTPPRKRRRHSGNSSDEDPASQNR